MFEEYTQDYLLSIMLQKAKDKGFPTAEGNLIYNASCLMAVMLEDAFDKAEEDYINSYPDTCDREHLIRFCRGRNIEPKAATNAKYYATYTGGVPVLDTVLTDGELNYTLSKTISADSDSGTYTVSLICNTEGKTDDKKGVVLYLVDYVEDFISCVITETYEYGTDEEDTEVLRERYFASFGIPGQFGNAQYWKDVALSVDGIGRALSVKSEGEDGEVTVLLIVTGYGAVVSQEALLKLTELCDEENAGNVVPFGQTVTVEAATEKTVDISVKLTLTDTAAAEDVTAEISNVTDEYFKELNLCFGDKTIILRRNALEARYFEIDGVLDCEILTLGGIDGNIELERNEIAVRGEITYAE